MFNGIISHLSFDVSAIYRIADDIIAQKSPTHRPLLRCVLQDQHSESLCQTLIKKIKIKMQRKQKKEKTKLNCYEPNVTLLK